MPIGAVQGGQFQDSSGNLVANGSITFQLSSPAKSTDVTPGQLVPFAPITYALNSLGSVPNGSPLWFNSSLAPAGTFYVVKIFNSTGALVRGPENWVISGSSPLNLATIVASSPSISYPIPVPNEVANISLTAQSAAIAQTALYAGGTSSLIRVSWSAKVTTPATTTSSLGPLMIYVTDADGTSLTIPMPHFSGLSGGLKGGGASSGGNGLNTTMLGLSVMVNTTVGSTVSYSFGYASAGATAMVYELAIVAEEL